MLKRRQMGRAVRLEQLEPRVVLSGDGALGDGGLEPLPADSVSIPVYDAIGGTIGIEKPDTSAIGMLPTPLLTQWAFFDVVGGRTVFEELDEAQFRRVLQTFVPEDAPVVLDVEHELYENHPDGRERLAEILEIAHEERPELDFSLFRLIPQRDWRSPGLLGSIATGPDYRADYLVFSPQRTS